MNTKNVKDIAIIVLVVIGVLVLAIYGGYYFARKTLPTPEPIYVPKVIDSSLLKRGDTLVLEIRNRPLVSIQKEQEAYRRYNEIYYVTNEDSLLNSLSRIAYGSVKIIVKDSI